MDTTGKVQDKLPTDIWISNKLSTLGGGGRVEGDH